MKGVIKKIGRKIIVGIFQSLLTGLIVLDWCPVDTEVHKLIPRDRCIGLFFFFLMIFFRQRNNALYFLGNFWWLSHSLCQQTQRFVEAFELSLPLLCIFQRSIAILFHKFEILYLLFQFANLKILSLYLIG